MSIYDLPRSRTEQQIEAWQPLVDWIKSQMTRSKDFAAAVSAVPERGVVQIA